MHMKNAIPITMIHINLQPPPLEAPGRLPTKFYRLRSLRIKFQLDWVMGSILLFVIEGIGYI